MFSSDPWETMALRTHSSGGNTFFRRLLRLFCLAGLQSASVLTTGEQNWPTSKAYEDNTAKAGPQMVIMGPDYVTVGVPSSYECLANCPSSSCVYSMTLEPGNIPIEGNALVFTVVQWMEAISITCSVTDKSLAFAETITKKPQVTAGPANVSIAGSDPMSTQNHTYSCHAYCRPSCSYSWRIDDGPWVGGSGNAITVNRQQLNAIKTLTCNATNTVSHLYATATRDMQAALGPTIVHIIGPNQLEVWKESRFFCFAQCSPSCRYSWVMNNQTSWGNEIDITLEHPEKSQTVRCEAQNTVSNMSVTISKTVQVSPTAGPAEVQIQGPDYIEVGKTSMFFCSARCLPSCNYTWLASGKRTTGTEMQITVDSVSESLNITCTVENTATKTSVEVQKTVHGSNAASGPSTSSSTSSSSSSSSIVSRPEKTSDLLLCAFVVLAVISL